MTMLVSVTATDAESGKTSTSQVISGGYAVICAEPLYLATKTTDEDGTVVLTLKLRKV